MSKEQGNLEWLTRLQIERDRYKAALEDIEAMNKNLPQIGLSDYEIRNKMEDRAMEALYCTHSSYN